MSTDWNRIANEAGKATDSHFSKEIAGLTQLNDAEINQLIAVSGISQKDMVAVLKTIQKSSASNEAKAKVIAQTNRGIEFLIALAAKVL